MTASPEAAFTLDGVGVQVDGRALLHPLTLTLPRGQVIGLLGHNGSGKSTLMKVLARQMPATSGTVRLAGCPLEDYRARDFSRRVAYLPQQTPATDGLRVAELVGFGRYPWHGAIGRVSRTDRARVADALEVTGTVAMADRVVDTLSGGERQRAFLAMLVAQDADCLLLDEPISALDVAQQLEVMSLVRALVDGGRSVVVILHDVNIAARYCDRLLVLAQGRRIAWDATDRLMHPDWLEAIYGVRMGVFRHPETQAPISYVL